MKHSDRRRMIGFLIIGALLYAAAAVVPANAGPGAGPLPQMTPFLTATPNAAGEIIYVVQSGDSLYRIAGIAGVSVQEIAALNGIEVNSVLTIGTRLLIGRATPVTPTQDPSQPLPTPEPTPTPTPVFGTADICILLFLDQNGNARHEDAEPPLAGGQVSVARVNGELAGEFTTSSASELMAFSDTPVGVCLDGLENGDYNVSVAVPENHNPTTAMNIPIRLNPGDTKYVQFGAQASSSSVGSDEGGANRSSILAFLGGMLLLGAAGLAILAARVSRRRRY